MPRSASTTDASARSRWMARIRSRDTAPERLLRQILWRRGRRYRLHVRLGRSAPDLVFAARRVVVFLDGCFWHGCPDHYVAPRSSRAFWSAKLRANVERDIRVTADLEQGWTVLRFWEHQVEEDPEGVADVVEAALLGKAVRRTPSMRVVQVDFLDTLGARERRHLVPLRGRARPRVVEQQRSTRKWTRQRPAASGARSQPSSTRRSSRRG